MFQIGFCEFVLFVTTVAPVIGRKYDLDEESKLLYGGKLSDVLNKFRRTPEYLDILLTKLESLTLQHLDNSNLAHTFFIKSLSTEIMERIKEALQKNPPRIAAFRGKKKQPLQIKRRQEAPPGAAGGESEEAQQSVTILDKYLSRKRPLTAAERNEWRDFVFDRMGRYVELIIEPLESDKKPQSQSSKAPVDVEPKPVETTPAEEETETEPEPEQEETTPADEDGNQSEEDNQKKLADDKDCRGRSGNTAMHRVNSAVTPAMKPARTLPRYSKNVIMLY